MDGASVTIQQSGAGEDMATRAHRADGSAVGRQPPQFGDQGLVPMPVSIDAAAQDHRRQGFGIGQGAVHGNGNAVAGDHRPAIEGIGFPPIEGAAADPVGQPQGFHRRSEGDHGELRHQEKPDPVAILLRPRIFHGEFLPVLSRLFPLGDFSYLTCPGALVTKKKEGAQRPCFVYMRHFIPTLYYGPLTIAKSPGGAALCMANPRTKVPRK